ncbi:MAG: hypothetical protein IPJ34_15415 [Myxococcales bacterium]|nr:hypothetical protein [Myxococcales bacterium]
MTVRLRGRVRGSGDVLRRAELLSEDGERVDGADGEAFDLVLEDGAVVRIEVPSDAAIVPLRVDRGVWSDLAKTPGAELLGRRTPAPHARIARFSTAIVRDGDAVVVEGETTDDVAIDEAAYRTTSARRVTGARALVVGVGDEGAAAVERELAARARRARAGAYSSRVTFALSEAFHATLARWRPISALAAGTVALLACWLPPWFALYIQTTALGGLGMLAVQRHLGRTPLKFSDGNEHPMTWFFWWVIFFPPSAALMPGILALWLAVVAALIFLGTHRTARRLGCCSRPHRFLPRCRTARSARSWAPSSTAPPVCTSSTPTAAASRSRPTTRRGPRCRTRGAVARSMVALACSSPVDSSGWAKISTCPTADRTRSRVSSPDPPKIRGRTRGASSPRAASPRWRSRRSPPRRSWRRSCGSDSPTTCDGSPVGQRVAR